MTLFHGWLLFPILLAVFQTTLSQTSSDVAQLEKFYYDKCLKNSGQSKAFEKLRNEAYEMFKYLQYSFKFLPDQKKSFCESQRANLVYRAKEIEIDLKACLAKDEMFLASFFRKSFEELLHFFCHNNGEYTRRLFSSEGAQCRKTIEESQNNDLDNCLNRIFAPTKNHITQAEICDDITVTRKCFMQLVDVNCPGTNDLKRLNEVFFDFIAKPCSSCVFVINNFILIVLVLLNVFMYN